MAGEIEHQGIVENIAGGCVRVKIVQTSACAMCKAAGHCASSEVKEKIIDVSVGDADTYHVGEHVRVVGAMSVGAQAVAYAFVFPLLLLMVTLFVVVKVTGDDWLAIGAALFLVADYYIVLHLNRGRLAKKLSFYIERLE